MRASSIHFVLITFPAHGHLRPQLGVVINLVRMNPSLIATIFSHTALVYRTYDDIARYALADDVLSWELEPDGNWRKVPTLTGVDTHRRLQELALARAQVPARAGDGRG